MHPNVSAPESCELSTKLLISMTEFGERIVDEQLLTLQ